MVRCSMCRSWSCRWRSRRPQLQRRQRPDHRLHRPSPPRTNVRGVTEVYPIAAGIVVQTRELWEELNPALRNLSVRTLFELSELPEEWGLFLERIERTRPDVIILDVSRLRLPLDEVVRRIRSSSPQ